MIFTLGLLTACQTTHVPPDHTADTHAAKAVVPAHAPVAPPSIASQPAVTSPEAVATAIQTEPTPPPLQSWPQQNWKERNLKPVNIGVILPLHGRYQQYGQTLLNGIRLAISDPAWGHLVKLTVIDSAGGPAVAAQAYQQLMQQRVNWVIGPLLRDNVKAVIPLLRDDVPVLSLSKDVELAQEHPALFIHSIARVIQARFMARQAIASGMRRMAVITGRGSSERAEAEMFRSAFVEAGGEIAGTLMLDSNNVNYINQLKVFRAKIDDDSRLRDLDLDLQLFAPLRNLDVRIPPGVDALYLATSGSLVATLAGQLAYVDLRHIPMFGSNRWMDGHLLDDAGRYLTEARFCQPMTPFATSKLVTQYRETWGEGTPDSLFALGYDTAILPLLLGSRMGLQGKQAIQALHDQAGFPAASGIIRFNEQGIAEKEFDVFIIKDAQILLNRTRG